MAFQLPKDMVKNNKFIVRIYPKFVNEVPVLTKEHAELVKSKFTGAGKCDVFGGYNVEEGWCDFYEKTENDLENEEMMRKTNQDAAQKFESEESNESKMSCDYETDLMDQLRSGKTIKVPPMSSGQCIVSTFDKKTGKYILKMKKLSSAPYDITAEMYREMLERPFLSEADEELLYSKIVKTSDDAKMVFENMRKEEAEKIALKRSQMPYLSKSQLFLIFLILFPALTAFWIRK